MKAIALEVSGSGLTFSGLADMAEYDGSDGVEDFRRSCVISGYRR